MENNIRGAYATHICENCGKQFERNEQNRVPKHYFCSDSCNAKWHWANGYFVKRKPQLEGNTIQVCEQCGKQFERKKKYRVLEHYFCSDSCNMNWHWDNGYFGERRQEDVFCEGCGKKITGRIRNVKHHYCNRDCYQKHQRRTKILRGIAADNADPYLAEARAMLERD